MNLLAKLYLLFIISLTSATAQASFLKPTTLIKGMALMAGVAKFVHDHNHEFFQTHKQVEAVKLRLDQIESAPDREKESQILKAELTKLEQIRAGHYTKSLGFLWYPSMDDAIKKHKDSIYS